MPAIGLTSEIIGVEFGQLKFAAGRIRPMADFRECSSGRLRTSPFTEGNEHNEDRNFQLIGI